MFLIIAFRFNWLNYLRKFHISMSLWCFLLWFRLKGIVNVLQFFLIILNEFHLSLTMLGLNFALGYWGLFNYFSDFLAVFYSFSSIISFFCKMLNQYFNCVHFLPLLASLLYINVLANFHILHPLATSVLYRLFASCVLLL